MYWSMLHRGGGGGEGGICRAIWQYLLQIKCCPKAVGCDLCTGLCSIEGVGEGRGEFAGPSGNICCRSNAVLKQWVVIYVLVYAP